jgi:pimeloyl-ACP methyl ester carboxylesterase
MALVQPLQGTGRDTELEGKLSQVQTQTLIAFGTTDRMMPPAMSRTHRERMSSCHFVMVDDAGHAVIT